jgi:hypothetical protein
MNARVHEGIDAAAVTAYFVGLQRRIVAGLEAEDGKPFRLDTWTRPEGGGGTSSAAASISPTYWAIHCRRRLPLPGPSSRVVPSRPPACPWFCIRATRTCLRCT